MITPEAGIENAPSVCSLPSNTMGNDTTQTLVNTPGLYMEDDTIVFSLDGIEYKYKMLYVNGGSYRKGEGDFWDDEGTPRPIVVVKSFRIGETEVTQALWKAVMGKEPTNEGGWTEQYGRGVNYPAYNVSYYDMIDFLRELNRKTGCIFRLPKEDEWVYAAKGGPMDTDNSYSGCNDEDNLEQYAWYAKNALFCGSECININHPDYRTHEVKTRKPNEIGFYDMTGNVWEVCEDLSGVSGSRHVMLGGCWSNFARDCRMAHRGDIRPERYSPRVGFRLVLAL